eukprot:315033-Chlamydomonas_euryale.AAC.1
MCCNPPALPPFARDEGETWACDRCSFIPAASTQARGRRVWLGVHTRQFTPASSRLQRTRGS